jgi:hypothetical protein
MAMQETGRAAFEAAQRHGMTDIFDWASQADQVKAKWADIELSVLMSAHRLQTVSDAWAENLQHDPMVVSLGQAAGRVVELLEAKTGFRPRRVGGDPIEGDPAELERRRNLTRVRPFPDELDPWPTQIPTVSHGPAIRMEPILANAERLPSDEPLAIVGTVKEVGGESGNTLKLTASGAKMAGFTGNMCSFCGSLQMVQTGTCQTCQSCSQPSGGCS